MIQEHDQVVLLSNIPEKDLKKDDIGTVIHIYPDKKAYEVEFSTLSGKTIAVQLLKGHQIREINSQDLPHTRIVAAQ